MLKILGAAVFALIASFGLAQGQGVQKSCAEGTARDGLSLTCATIIQPQATASAVESSHVFKASGPSTAVDFQVNNSSASALWVMLFDAAVAPTGAGAAVTGCTNAAAARPCVAKWYQIGANSTIGISWAPGPFLQLQTGQVIACSSTGPFTLTYSVSCTFSAEAM
jgi:hypothetical protein